jgi:hypothetical protein
MSTATRRRRLLHLKLPPRAVTSLIVTQLSLDGSIKVATDT